jgi:hypothetical protein
MRKILSNRPWLLVAVFFLTFVALWAAFIVFAVRHQPPPMSMEKLEEVSHGSD